MGKQKKFGRLFFLIERSSGNTIINIHFASSLLFKMICKGYRCM